MYYPVQIIKNQIKSNQIKSNWCYLSSYTEATAMLQNPIEYIIYNNHIGLYKITVGNIHFISMVIRIYCIKISNGKKKNL